MILFTRGYIQYSTFLFLVGFATVFFCSTCQTLMLADLAPGEFLLTPRIRSRKAPHPRNNTKLLTCRAHLFQTYK